MRPGKRTTPLTDGQKALVSNYETLTAAEEAYAALDEEPQSSVKVYYVLPDGDPQEVQAGDTVYIAPGICKRTGTAVL